MQVCSDNMDKFLSCCEVIHEFTGKGGSSGNRILFLNTAHYHTHVLCFDYYRNAKWLEGFLDAITNLHS